MAEPRSIGQTSSLISAPGEAWLKSRCFSLARIPALARHASPGTFTIPSTRRHRSSSLPLLTWRGNRWLFSTRINDDASYAEYDDGSASLQLRHHRLPDTLLNAIPASRPPLERVLVLDGPIFADLRAKIVSVTDWGFVIFLYLEIQWRPAPSPFPRPKRGSLLALRN